MSLILSTSSLTKKYRGKPQMTAVNNLSFSVNKNEFVCIFGPSGSGKTTLLRLLSGITPPTSGSFKYYIKDQTPILGFVFQDDRLLPWKTAEENVALVTDDSLNNRKRHDIVRRQLRAFGITKLASKYPYMLSGGEKQLVSLARALVNDPHIVFMDEPFSHLDQLTARVLRVDMLKVLARKTKTVLFVTHNPLEAIFLADRILVMNNGSITEEFRVQIPRPRSQKLYEEFIYQKKPRKLLKSLLSSINSPYKISKNHSA